MRYGLVVWGMAAAYFAVNLAVGLSIHDWNFTDENTYGVAAVKILYHESCTVYQLNIPTLCNYEHPPLAKALGALSLYLFGWVEPHGAVFDAQFLGSLETLSSSPLWFLAFRFFQLLMGALSLVLIYVIAARISGDRRLALAASCLLVLEPLYAFFSRTDYLDVPMVFFALCAYAVYFSGYRLGPVGPVWLSGSLLGLSALCKETGVVFVVPLVAYHWLFGRAAGGVRLRESAYAVSAMVATAAAGLQLYDALGNTPFPNALDQLSYMVRYAHSIACVDSCLFSPGPTSWFTFFMPTRWSDGFSGNQVLLWLVFVWVPMGGYLLWRSRGTPVTPEGRLFVFSLLLFLATFLENELIYLGGRKTWIYFYLTVVPSVSLGGAYLITRPQLARWMKVAVAALLVLGYVWAYAAGPSFLMYD